MEDEALMLLSRRTPNFLIILGSLLLLIALLLFGLDAVRSLQAGTVTYYTLGEAWASFHISSLNGFQVVIERYVEPYTIRGIWTAVFLPILLGPTWTPFLVLGGSFYFVGRWMDRVPGD